jgi:hypothetical protein
VRQVPAITELAQLDAAGIEQLKLSRLGMGAAASNADFSQDPKFTEAVAHKVYYGPVYLRRQSEPYMTLSLAGTRRDAGVSVAEVNLKLIWDVIKAINVGERGVAYVLDAQNRVIAHSNFRVDILRDAAGRITVDADLSLFQHDFRASPMCKRRARQAPTDTFRQPVRAGYQWWQDAHCLRLGCAAARFFAVPRPPRLARVRGIAGRGQCASAMMRFDASRAKSVIES